MKISLSTSLHLDHGSYSLDARSGDQPPMQSFVPIGLLSLKASLDKAGLDVATRVIEVNGLINKGLIRNDEHFYDNIVDAIWDKDDDLVGLMTDADSLPHTILTAQHIRQRTSKTKILLGGPAVSTIGKMLLETIPEIDLIISGEGELTFEELLEVLLHEESPRDIAGLYWRNNGEVCFGGVRTPIEDLDALPIPDFDAYDMSAGAPLYLDVGRGCPFVCQFCATAPYWNRQYRMKSINRILEEMTLLKTKYDRDSLSFSHDIFTANNEWTSEFCRRLTDANLGITWSCSTRTDITTPQLLENMAEAGCVEIYYGIETGSNKTQAAIRKGLDLDWSRKIVASTIGVGIRPITGFIIGYPTESEQTLNDTLTCYFDFLNVGSVKGHLFTLCPFHEAPMFTDYASTIQRKAEYRDLRLSKPSQKLCDGLIENHRDIFAAQYRFDTPEIDPRLVDASEELSGHLVVLKSIWPSLLLYYPTVLDWYTRWVAWIESYNALNRPNTRLKHQGDAADLLKFISEELDRLDLEDIALSDLIRYEDIKLQARLLNNPKREATRIVHKDMIIECRCQFLIEGFNFDIEDILDRNCYSFQMGENPVNILFAKTKYDSIDTMKVGPLTIRILESLGEPRVVGYLLESIRNGEQQDEILGKNLLDDLAWYGLFSEVRA